MADLLANIGLRKPRRIDRALRLHERGEAVARRGTAQPKVAVLTCTRDRLGYTQHCFARLREFAGCSFDHFVLDNGSTDGTQAWLQNYGAAGLVCLSKNIGVNRGVNRLIDLALKTDSYDVIVKFDNDCDVVTENTLAECGRVALEHSVLVSPKILGLETPVEPIQTIALGNGDVFYETPVIGGIFLVAPAWLYSVGRYRHAKKSPVWGNDDYNLCGWWRSQGLRVGYLRGYEAWHYRSTAGQHEDFSWYFERRVAEGGPP